MEETVDKNQLKEIVAYEERVYFGSGGLTAEKRFRGGFRVYAFCYLKQLRRYEYLCNLRERTRSPLKKKLLAQRVKLCDRKKNRLSMLTHLDIVEQRVGRGVKLCHPNIVLNGYAGEDCVFHGNNVLGNKQTGSDKVPRLGSRVDVGTGACVIGDVLIADDCVIGAGAVVTRSFPVPGTVIAGVPAKEIGRKTDE